MSSHAADSPIRRVEFTCACRAWLDEEWHVDVPADTSDDELREAILERESAWVFDSQTSDGEEDREITRIDGKRLDDEPPAPASS